MTRRSLLVVGLLLAGGLAVWWFLRPSGAPEPSEPSAPRQPARPTTTTSQSRPPRRGAPAVQPRRRRLSPDARARLLQAITRARALRQRAAAAVAAAATTPRAAPAAAPASAPAGSLDKDYLRARIQELIPLVKECYDNVLADRPDVGGKLIVEFSIAGEPAIGGIVTESRIAAESTVQDPGLQECVQETMYALELDAPSQGGTVKVRYPFRFARE